jgi:hypothetical protein
MEAKGIICKELTVGEKCACDLLHGGRAGMLQHVARTGLNTR